MSQIALRRSPPYSKFKSAAGQSNHFLITILVGLDAVRAGAVDKNPDFSTTWEPRDVARSAARSRAYAINTSLVWISDLVDVYRRTAQRLKGVCTTADLKMIEGGVGDGRSRRLGRYSRYLDLGVPSELSLVQLGIHWRNRVAHSEAAGLVDGDVRGALRGAAEEIRGTYNGLDVEDLIKHEASGRAPTFKEIASIIHASHRLVEVLDRAMLRRIDVRGLAEATIAEHLNEGSSGEWNVRTLSLWPGTPEKTLSKLKRVLAIAGFQTLLEPDPGAALPNDYLTTLAELSVHEARQRFPSESDPASDAG